MRDFVAKTDPTGPQLMEPPEPSGGASDEKDEAEKSALRRFVEAFSFSFWFINVDTGQMIDAVVSFFQREK